MRLSTRLLRNAISSYARLATTFVVGIVYVWYVIGEVGMTGFGAIAIGSGAFGIAALLDNAIRQSLSRELAASLASGTSHRVERTLVSSLVFTVPASLLVLVLFAALSVIAWMGGFRTPGVNAGLPGALAAIFAASGVVTSASLLCSPYLVATLADQRIVVDNSLRVLKRLVPITSAFVAFGILGADATLVQKLQLFALFRVVLGLLEVLVEVIASRMLVRSLRLRLSKFDRAECMRVASTTWHTMQFIIATGLNAHLLALVINLMFGLAYNGMWEIVIRIGGHARMVGEGVIHGLDPLATHLKERNARVAIVNLMTKMVRYPLMLLVPFTLLYGVFLDPILRLWIGGRLQRDELLAEAGITFDGAIHLITIMASIYLLAELSRASTRGVERILYGMGFVSSYSWFAKWSVLLTGSGAVLLMWLFGSPIAGVAPLAVVQFVYFDVIVLGTACRKMDIPVRGLLRRSLPRPLVAGALLVPPLLWTRSMMPPLDLGLLAMLLLGFGVACGPILLFVGLIPAERRRLVEFWGRGLARLGLRHVP